MVEPLAVEAGEKSVEELLAALAEGRRVVVTTEFLGSRHEVTLRSEEGTFYCDTPTRLHRHETREEMAECLRRHGYGREDGGS